jgi:uncharacterized protein
VSESAVTFACAGVWLYGVVHRPNVPGRRGVVLIVGGPQYRVGSHRQFVLLARHLAQSGIAVLRFDYRGMGDSGGEARNFEHVDDDIRAAIDCLMERVPEVKEVALWGLCDAASAALFYAPDDARVTGLALLNPWVRTEQTVAQTYLRHYYLDRLRDPTFWRKLTSGELGIAKAFRSLLQTLRTARGGAVRQSSDSVDLPQRMLAGLQRFRGYVLVILSGDDITANEFRDVTQRSSSWQHSLAEERITRRDLPGANHTFSRREWRDQVSRWTAQWLGAW